MLPKFLQWFSQNVHQKLFRNLLFGNSIKTCRKFTRYSSRDSSIKIISFRNFFNGSLKKSAPRFCFHSRKIAFRNSSSYYFSNCFRDLYLLIPKILHKILQRIPLEASPGVLAEIYSRIQSVPLSAIS